MCQIAVWQVTLHAPSAYNMPMKRVLAWVSLGLLLGLCGNASADEPTSNVRFSVIRDCKWKADPERERGLASSGKEGQAGAQRSAIEDGLRRQYEF